MIISNCLEATDDLRASTKSARKTLFGCADLLVKLSVKYDDDFIFCFCFLNCYLEHL